MSSRPPLPIANGTRTDHPIPDLPFVDDSQLPVEDPRAIEAIGRRPDTKTWGRHDPLKDGAWVAFTTDAVRHDLGWVVRYHPEHGRTVTLYRNPDAADMHMELRSTVILFRAGSYWWDGQHWFRPQQVFDWAAERYIHRQVPAAVAVAAADLLTGARPARAGTVVSGAVNILDVDPDTAPGLDGSWPAHLAWWAAQRPPEALPLDRCIVNVLAPELATDQLVGVPELAKAAGLAASTVRAYMTRAEQGDSDIPTPQAVLGNRAVWSRAVVEDYAERRRRSPEVAADILRTEPIGAAMHAPGVADLFNRLATTFHDRLWKNPDRRKRWALRWRSAEAVQQIANDLSWTVAGDLRAIVPVNSLAGTIRGAFLYELATSQRLHRDNSGSPLVNLPTGEPPWYAVDAYAGRMLGWLIRHDPDTATHAINEIVVRAGERPLSISRATINESLRRALRDDDQFKDREQLKTYLEATLTDEDTTAP